MFFNKNFCNRVFQQGAFAAANKRRASTHAAYSRISAIVASRVLRPASLRAASLPFVCKRRLARSAAARADARNLGGARSQRRRRQRRLFAALSASHDAEFNRAIAVTVADRLIDAKQRRRQRVRATRRFSCHRSRKRRRRERRLRATATAAPRRTAAAATAAIVDTLGVCGLVERALVTIATTIAGCSSRLHTGAACGARMRARAHSKSQSADLKVPLATTRKPLQQQQKRNSSPPPPSSSSSSSKSIQKIKKFVDERKREKSTLKFSLARRFAVEITPQPPPFRALNDPIARR